MTVDVDVLRRSNVLVPGLVLAVVAAFVVRPLAIAVFLRAARLRANEIAFVVFAGLKGAVPLLLGEMMLASGIHDAQRWYGIVAIVVVFSVLVQGSLTPTAATVLKIPMRRM